MKIDIIKKEHIIKATNIIEKEGIPKNYVRSNYYVKVDTKEYPFKYLIKIAYELASNKKELVFQSKEDYRAYVENLGFNINYYAEGYNFFSKEELEYYHSIANKDYRKSNKDHVFYGQKLYSILAKVNYWAKQLTKEGFKQKDQGLWLTGYTSRVSPYFWPRIYKGKDNSVFFNVEVNGVDRFIGYKLDGHYQATKALKPEQIEVLNKFKDSGDWEWPKISFDDIDTYNWERLIKESSSYIEKYLDKYDELKKDIFKESKIARITWNTHGWVKPSGPNGKSVQDSFEKENGYGHEEWLFDGDKTINGMKYGFIEPINKHHSLYQGRVFNISLYTRNDISKKHYWVTTLKNVEVISVEEAEQILDKYIELGWFEEMKADLYNMNLDPISFENPILLFNMKFSADQINDIEGLIEIEHEDIPKTLRYTLLDISSNIQKKYKKLVQKDFSFEDSGSESGDHLALTSSRQRQPVKETELPLKHNHLQKELLLYLQSKYGKENVKRECRAYGSARIDIVHKNNTGYIFYEIKTYNCLRVSIRESIGQLLEYSLYPSAKNVQRLVVVSDVAPSDEIRLYIATLNNFVKIPISYIQFDANRREIIIELENK